MTDTDAVERMVLQDAADAAHHRYPGHNNQLFAMRAGFIEGYRYALSSLGLDLSVLAALKEGTMVAVRQDPKRCAICDWPLAESREKGCVRGDCSYRPEWGTEEAARIARRRAELSAPAKPEDIP